MESKPIQQVVQNSTQNLPPDRIGSLSDGVFAVALTILVLGIQLPSQGSILAALKAVLPSLCLYAITFILIGIYWVAHHNIFQLFVQRADRDLLWINLVYLLFVVLIPFSTSLLDRYLHEPLAVVIYASNLFCIGLMMLAIVSYIIGHPQMMKPHNDITVIRFTRRRTLFALCLYPVIMATAFITPTMSLVLALFYIIIYILPRRFDGIWTIGMHASTHPEQLNEE